MLDNLMEAVKKIKVEAQPLIESMERARADFSKIVQPLIESMERAVAEQ